MTSVTNRIKQIKQPRGGYIKPSSLTPIEFEDGYILNENENIHAALVGMAVDYLTRFMMGTDLPSAFQFSLKGAQIAETLANRKNAIKKAELYLTSITGLDAASVIAACKLVTFDVWYRNPAAAIMAKSADEIVPDSETIQNIIILVERNINFLKNYGPVVKDGFDFQPNGYTEVITAGDGDFLTADTIWDLKASRSNPDNKHTLQLLIYWIMGQHSGQDIFTNVTKLGIFNPRFNRAYFIAVKDIPTSTINEIETTVIGY